MWLTITVVVLAIGLVAWATTRRNRIGHWARVTLMFLSGGFIFPNATVEDEDITNYGANKGAKVTK